jgi:hypothetical protein
MPADTLRCPHCALKMTVRQTPSGSSLAYDEEEWKRRCKRPDLMSPAMCLAERDVDERPETAKR